MMKIERWSHRTSCWTRFLLTAFLGCTVSALSAEPLKVAFFQGGEAPFMFPEKSEETGIYRDMLSRIAELSGLEFEVVYYPFPRGQAMFDSGKLHIEPGANPAWRQDAKVPGVFSRPFAKSSDVLIFQPGKRKPVKSAGDLAGEAVGAINGYVYPFFAEAFASGSVTRNDAVNETGVLDMLSRGRYDQAIINEAIARWWMKRNPEFSDYEIGDVISEMDIMFRVHPSKADAVERIDTALEKMIAGGEIEAILAKYR